MILSIWEMYLTFYVIMNRYTIKWLIYFIIVIFKFLVLFRLLVLFFLFLKDWYLKQPTRACDIVLVQVLVVGTRAHPASRDGQTEGTASTIIHPAGIVT